jgi:cysteine-rich repeat protein
MQLSRQITTRAPCVSSLLGVSIMKAIVGSAVAALFALACQRPDADLFGDATGGSAAKGGSGAGPANQAGTTPAGGGVTSSNGAGAPNGGAEPMGAAGEAMTPDVPGAGGTHDGAAGSPEPPEPPKPVCGNGVIEGTEECDDAGQPGRDGCDDACQVECQDYGDSAVESKDHHCYGGWDEADFDGAVAACEERGGHLATISSAAENAIVRPLVNESKFIGGFEDVQVMTEDSGVYVWITGEAFDYTNWASQEPDRKESRCNSGNYNGRCYEHCLAMNGQGTWEDHRCDVADGYVCEWEPPHAKP